jgi:hypothetical protein
MHVIYGIIYVTHKNCDHYFFDNDRLDLHTNTKKL